MLDTAQPHAPGRFDATQGPRVIRPHDGKMLDFGSFGVRFLIGGDESGGGFSLIEHPIPPRTLVAPLHRHAHEDEYSYVVAGRMGAQLGDAIVYADVGDLVFKPRNQWHTFWNAGDTVWCVLELISPAGFERMFAEMVADPAALSGNAAQAMDVRYGLDVEYASVARLCAEHGLTFPM